MRYLLLATFILALCGCSKTAEAEDKAIWMCLNGHWLVPEIAQFPADHAPELYISASDVAFIKARHQQLALERPAFIMDVHANTAMTGIRQAFAARSECELLSIHVDPSKTRLTIEMQRRSPSNNVWTYLGRFGELRTLRSASHVSSTVKEWIDAEGAPMETQTAAMTFIKERERWVMSFGLKAAHEAELAQKAARTRLEEELIRHKRAKEELERELKTRLDGASVFEQLEVKMLSAARLSEPESKRLGLKNGYRFHIARNGKRFNDLSFAVFAMGFKLKGGTSLWERRVMTGELGAGELTRFSLDVELGDWVMPSDVEPYINVQKVVRQGRDYDDTSIKQARQEAQSLKEKLAIVDAEIAKLRKQLN